MLRFVSYARVSRLKLLTLLAVITVLTMSVISPVSANTQPTEAGFQTWLTQFRAEAAAAGISQNTINSALSGINLNRKVLKHNDFQPEFVKPIWSYLGSAVSESRIKNGREKFAEHEALLREVAAKYQIEPQLITAIWGLETAYGFTFGGFNVIEALATLAYHGRRAQYGKQQLMAALKIIDAGHIPAEQMQGSWAGAMGHTQFIPTSYQSRAIDYDNDGKRDIWNSLGDVFASTANYMQNAKWRAGETWGAAVFLPDNFDWSLADKSVRKTVTEWAELGIRPMVGNTLPNSSGTAWILLPAGHRGPAFMVLPNFKAIMRYNNSTAYALGVSLLSDEIIGKTVPQFNWPTELQALTRKQRKELQQRLTNKGYDTGGVDGILGANSRKALRAWQANSGLIPDAFATVEQLELLRQP